MQTIRMGGPEAEALTAATDFAAIDSNAGKARVANEDFKNRRLFMGIFYDTKFRYKCNVLERLSHHTGNWPRISKFRHSLWQGDQGEIVFDRIR